MALTTCRRSHTSVAEHGVTSSAWPAAAAAPSTRSTAASTSSATGTGSRRVAWASICPRSSRSSTIAPTRVASAAIRSASCWATAGSWTAARVSASTASAPTGVFSSWLTLATKSRRTVSIRRASVTSRTRPDRADAAGIGHERPRGHEEDLGRWAEQLELARALLAVAGPVEQLAQRAAGQRVGVTGIVEALGRTVAQDDLAPRVDHHDRIGDGVHGLREPSPVQVGGGIGIGGAGVAELGATTDVHLSSSSSGARASAAHPNRPVM